jgi:hypothetical protein
VDIFLLAVPFAVFLIPFLWAAYGIGGSATDPNEAPPPAPGARRRLARSILVVSAAILAAIGAAAAASAGAFARTTNAGYYIEPTALFFALQAMVNLVLLAIVALPGWSTRRAWALRMIGVYWACLAIPAMILADAGPDWLSTDPGHGVFFLAVPAFVWEAAAALAPALLLWIASRSEGVPAVPAVPAVPLAD